MSSNSTKYVVCEENKVLVNNGWVVVLYNDDHHTFRYVIECLCKIVMLDKDTAIDKVLEIDIKGEAVVAGPMSKYEAQDIASKIEKNGPDPYSKNPELNVGLKVLVKEC